MTAAGGFWSAPGATSYAQKSGNVFDAQPREISNLIVDQTSTNPAAVAAAGFPVRTQGNPGLSPAPPILTPWRPAGRGVPAGCVPAHETLFIPNVTTDVGLSPPYNSLFTLFGQFFDHGVDQTVKSGGTVFVPLKADDPLITGGPDGKPGKGDEVPPSQRVHGPHPGAEPARPGRHPGHRRRHAGRNQHGLAVRRPVPDLHVPPLPPGVPAGVRRTTPPASRSLPASCSAAPRGPSREWHGHVGRRSSTRPRSSLASSSRTRTSPTSR